VCSRWQNIVALLVSKQALVEGSGWLASALGGDHPLAMAVLQLEDRLTSSVGSLNASSGASPIEVFSCTSVPQCTLELHHWWSK